MLERSQAGLQCWLQSSEQRGLAHAYRLAGRILVADAPLAPLASYAIAEPALPTGPPPQLTGPGQLICSNAGWIADAWREVRVWRHEQGLRVRVEGVGEFAVTPDGPAVTGSVGTTGTTLVEALLGAPLVLTLALRGAWCLHAGAAMVSGSIVAFAGESGRGKSTLAEYLNAAEEGGWRRVADDTLPVSLGPNGVVAHPHFPQLKLPAVEHYPVDAPASPPLAAIFVIGPPNGEEAVSVSPLGRRQAMQALIRHTVAARLFDKPLLAAHLDFCAEAAARIPVWRLAYPHRREVLPQVRDAIFQALSELPARRGPRIEIARGGR